MHADGAMHVEVFFDPQTHTSRGVSFSTIIHGIRNAVVNAERELGLTCRLIMCILRHLSCDDAMKTLEDAKPYKEWITAIGLDSGEVGKHMSSNGWSYNPGSLLTMFCCEQKKKR